MTNALTPFNFGQFTVSTTTTGDAVWFSAADVCSALGIKNHRDSLQHLDADEKGVVSTDTLGGQQKVSVVNESGLYALVLRSRKPEARKFAKWVTSEVLPAIRKTGGYQQPVQATPEIPSLSIDTLIALIGGGMIDHYALLKIADASGMALYVDVCNAKDKGWGEEVAAQIDETLPQADLRAIVNKATQVLWMRALKAAKTDRPVPQRTQFAMDGKKAVTA